MWNEKHMTKLEGLLAQAQAAGGAARVDKQHQSGKFTARERMEMLFDAGTFVEIGALRKSSNRVRKDLPRFGYGCRGRCSVRRAERQWWSPH